MSKHVAVLMGGWSAERESSLRSGKACADAAERVGYRVSRVDVGRDIAEVLIYNRALTAAERRAVVVYLNKKYLYGNIDPAADPDQDGLTNLEEENLLTDLNNPDTDGDGVSDGDEVHKYKSNPLSTDSDGDLLNDGFEVNVLHTDPTKADTDGDGFSDYYEFHLLTDPLDPNSKPKKTTAAKIDFLDTPGLSLSERKDNPRRLAILRDAGGLLVVLNGFAGGDLVVAALAVEGERLHRPGADPRDRPQPPPAALVVRGAEVDPAGGHLPRRTAQGERAARG